MANRWWEYGIEGKGSIGRDQSDQTDPSDPASFRVLNSLRMRAKVPALLALFVLSFGLSVGAHPCGGAEQGAVRQVAAASGAPSCHSESPKQPPPSGHRGCCDPDGRACWDVCHLMAVVSLAPSAPAAGPVGGLLLAEAGVSLPPLGEPIDHIPLG